jgi:hypothetical protein
MWSWMIWCDLMDGEKKRIDVTIITQWSFP